MKEAITSKMADGVRKVDGDGRNLESGVSRCHTTCAVNNRIYASPVREIAKPVSERKYLVSNGGTI